MMSTANFFSKRWPLIPESPADPTRFPEQLRPIIELFIEDVSPSPIELTARIDYTQNLILYGASDENTCELMLRLRTYNEYLTIARIEFFHKRQGYMKRLENILLHLSHELDYKGICIECANLPSIIAYVHKNGYEPMPNVPGNFVLEAK